MILKKTIINEQETYLPISFEEALVYPNKDELVFTDEDEEGDFEDALEELEENEEDEDEVINENHTSINGTGLIDIGKNIVETITSSIGSALNLIKNEKHFNSKTTKILTILPFMEDDDIHEIVERIINNDEEYKDIDLVAIMPFLEDDDCDALFKKAIVENDEEYKYNVASLAPFVSEKCLSELVDEYLQGKHQNLDFTSLFPFMDSKDIKKIFKTYINK